MIVIESDSSPSNVCEIRLLWTVIAHNALFI